MACKPWGAKFRACSFPYHIKCFLPWSLIHPNWSKRLSLAALHLTRSLWLLLNSPFLPRRADQTTLQTHPDHLYMLMCSNKSQQELKSHEKHLQWMRAVCWFPTERQVKWSDEFHVIFISLNTVQQLDMQIPAPSLINESNLKINQTIRMFTSLCFSRFCNTWHSVCVTAHIFKFSVCQITWSLLCFSHTCLGSLGLIALLEIYWRSATLHVLFMWWCDVFPACPSIFSL